MIYIMFSCAMGKPERIIGDGSLGLNQSLQLIMEVKWSLLIEIRWILPFLVIYLS